MRRRFVLWLVPLAMTGRAHASDPAFSSIDVPGAHFTVALDVNARGEVVGRYIDADERNHGFLRSSTGEFTTIDFPTAVLTVAQGISSRGDIVGFYRSTEQGLTRGFLRAKNGELTTLDHPAATKSPCLFLPAGGTNASGINDRGDIVGGYCDGDGKLRGYLFRSGTFAPVAVPASLASYSGAGKINSKGQIVGRYKGTDGKFHVYLLDAAKLTTLDFPGAVETADPKAGNPGINARGDIVCGYCAAEPCSNDKGNLHGFLLRQGKFTTIDFPGARATGLTSINDSGDIAGFYRDDLGVHGFLRRSKRPGGPNSK